MGPNGAGKTTLLKIAMGLEDRGGGSVITARNIKVGYLSQDLHDVESCEKNTRSGECSSRKNSTDKKYNSTKNVDPEKERQEIEAQIISLEYEIQEMEGLFDKSTPPEKIKNMTNC